jgi:RNA-binding protein
LFQYIAFRRGFMKSRRGLGTVSHLSRSSGNLILKAEAKVRIGESAFAEGGRRVGIIYDLFGPVKHPFIAIRPGVKAPEKYVGEPLFLERKKR